MIKKSDDLKDFLIKESKPGGSLAEHVKQPKKKSEDLVRKACNKWFKANNWIQKTIYTGGIPLPGGGYVPNPAKGIPDCVAFHRITKRMVWIEYKNSDGGVLSIDQKDWHYLLKLCGCEVYIISSLKQLKEVLSDVSS